MTEIEQTLTRWKASLCPKIEVGGLLTRNPVAHKWKAPFRCLVLRETTFWRIHDLLSQCFMLHEAHQTLGSRILLRSGFETLAILIYLNQSMKNVSAGVENFHEFSLKTCRLLLGSKDESTQHAAVNILTVLEKCGKRYPGLPKLYATLSESAHPNFEGVCYGYSRIDHEDHVANFSNNMAVMYEDNHLSAMELCMSVYEVEYDKEWPKLFEKLEAWITTNDAALEDTKDDSEGDF